MNLIALFAIILFLLAFNGLFVAAEFAAVSVKRPRLAQLVAEGNRLAQRILSLVEQPTQLDNFISTCQLGITVTSLALGSYAQARVIDLLAPFLARFTPSALEAATAIATTLVLLVLTILQVILAELVPKSISLRYPERMALLTIRPIGALQMLLRPLIAFFNGSGQLVLRLFGTPGVIGHGHIHSSEEIVILVEESQAGGVLDQEERALLVRTLELRKLTARKVMIPRTRMLTADVNEPIEVLLQLLARSSFSRMPLYQGTVDKIIGMVHIKDLLLAHRRQRNLPNHEVLTGHSCLHPVQEVPDSLNIGKVMEAMQKQRLHLAIIVDEYGGTAGMITFEDLIEEIIGDFRDEFDKNEVPPWELRNRNELWLRGDLQLTAANDLIEVDFSTAEAETVGGLISSEIGRIPEPGERVEINQRYLRVERLQGNSILLVSLVLTPDELAQIHGQPPPGAVDNPVKAERIEPRTLQPSEQRL